jgi:hypothetical protein
MRHDDFMRQLAQHPAYPPKLTIGLDLGDRSNWYCLLDESGNVVLE